MSAQAVTGVRSAPWGPLGRRDVRLALAVAVVQIVGTVAIQHRNVHAHQACWWGPCHRARGLDPGAYLLLAIGPVALLLRRRVPLGVLGVVFTATIVYAVIGYPAGPVFLALTVAFATVVIGGHRSVGVLTVIAGWAMFLWLPAAFGRGDVPTLGEAVALAAWLAVLLAGAELVRGRRERTAALRLGREQEVRRRAEEERLRIARELHDVLAHNISLINVQSGVALHLLEQQPEQARSALSIINEASADALREVRSVLGVLRGVDEQVPRAPTAGLAQLGELISRSAAAGVRVQVQVEGRRRPLPTSVDLAAFRMVQESLTNVARHSQANAARVRLDFGEAELTVQVDDEGVGRVRGGPGDGEGGNGIAGMRERAVALGGTLDAGPRGDRGFRVWARLPLRADA
ncbi:MAG TPA: histidine kinase [Solirubrobacteraceae bacterium]